MAPRPLLSPPPAAAESGVCARALSIGLLHVDREAGAGLRRHLAWRPTGVALFLARLLDDLGAPAAPPDGSFLRSRAGGGGAGVEICALLVAARRCCELFPARFRA